MTTQQTAVKCIHTGVFLRYQPTKITKKAKHILIDYVTVYGVKGRSLGVTMEFAYRQLNGQKPPAFNQQIMTEECQKWCRAEYRDPQLPISRYSKGIHQGVNHSWGSIFTCGPADYSESDPLEIIDTIPTHL